MPSPYRPALSPRRRDGHVKFPLLLTSMAQDELHRRDAELRGAKHGQRGRSSWQSGSVRGRPDSDV